MLSFGVASGGELLTTFRDAGAVAPDELAGTLAALCTRARAALVGLEIDDLALVRALARHLGDADPERFCAQCRVEELAIATLAASGSNAAIVELEARHFGGVEATCKQFAGAEHTVDDLRQTIRDRLFVGESATIAQYNGQGSLATWLRVIATRMFIDLGRRKGRMREYPVRDDSNELAAATDVELDAIKAEHRTAVTQAIADAVRTLEPAERHLLRQHFAAGLTIDQLAAVLGIHRATVARRIARARDILAERVRTLLSERLRVDEAELGDLLGLVISNLDRSIRALLATPTPR